MTVFYYDKEKAEQGILFCLGQEEKVLTSEEMQEQGKEKLYKNAVTYTGEGVLIGHPIVEGDTVRKATEKELVDKGIITLGKGEILEGDNIKTVDRPQEYPYAYEWESPNWVLNQNLLPSGVYHNGEKFIEVPMPDGARMVWNRDLNVWEEKGTDEEIKSWYHQKIAILKEQSMENGCWYVDEGGQKHRQKVRPEKDVSLLCSVIYKLETKQKLGEENPTEMWAFEDGDIKEIDIDEALRINLKCGDYVSAIYKAEAMLKVQDVNRELTFEKFTELVDSLSDAKTYVVEEKTNKTYITKNTFGSW